MSMLRSTLWPESLLQCSMKSKIAWVSYTWFTHACQCHSCHCKDAWVGILAEARADFSSEWHVTKPKARPEIGPPRLPHGKNVPSHPNDLIDTDKRHWCHVNFSILQKFPLKNYEIDSVLWINSSKTHFKKKTMLSLQQIKLPRPRMLPSFAELWPLSSWDSTLPKWPSRQIVWSRHGRAAASEAPKLHCTCRLLRHPGLYTIHHNWKITKKRGRKLTLEWFDDVWCRLWSILHWIWCCHWAWPISMAKALQLKMRKNSNWKLVNWMVKIADLVWIASCMQNYQWPMSKSNSQKSWLSIRPLCTWTMSSTELEQRCQSSFMDCENKGYVGSPTFTLQPLLRIAFHLINQIPQSRVVFPLHQLRTCLFSALEDSELLGSLWRRWLHQASRDISTDIDITLNFKHRVWMPENYLMHLNSPDYVPPFCSVLFVFFHWTTFLHRPLRGGVP